MNFPGRIIYISVDSSPSFWYAHRLLLVTLLWREQIPFAGREVWLPRKSSRFSFPWMLQTYQCEILCNSMQPVFWKKLDSLKNNFNIFMFKFFKVFWKKN